MRPGPGLELCFKMSWKLPDESSKGAKKPQPSGQNFDAAT